MKKTSGLWPNDVRPNLGCRRVRRGAPVLESGVTNADHGLWPHGATAVLMAMKNDKANESMSDGWCDDATGYPPQLFAVLFLSASLHAIAWIDANKPKHWARPMFLPPAERDALLEGVRTGNAS